MKPMVEIVAASFAARRVLAAASSLQHALFGQSAVFCSLLAWRPNIVPTTSPAKPTPAPIDSDRANVLYAPGEVCGRDFGGRPRLQRESDVDVLPLRDLDILRSRRA